MQCPLEACLTASSSTALAERLSLEASLGAASQFAPYIATLLPDRAAFVPYLPRFWDAQRLQLATDGGALQRAVTADQPRQDAVSDAWALACVDSRCNVLPDSSYALTPVLDLINHDGAVQTSAQVVNGVLFLDVAAKSIVPPQPEPILGQPPLEEPQEVCISYGDLTNLQALLNYGFVVEPGMNRHNTESFQVSVFRQAPVTATVRWDGSMDPLALGVLRRHLATAKELETCDLESGYRNSLMVPFLSRRNEVDVYALMAGYLEEAAHEARLGAEIATKHNDALVSAYLAGRLCTLQSGLDRIQKLYPEVLG